MPAKLSCRKTAPENLGPVGTNVILNPTPEPGFTAEPDGAAPQSSAWVGSTPPLSNCARPSLCHSATSPLRPLRHPLQLRGIHPAQTAIYLHGGNMADVLLTDIDGTLVDSNALHAEA